MSSILKALKKLEDENNARTPDSLKINAEILRGGDSARHSAPGILLAALLLFLCGGVAMYFFMKPDGNSRVTASSPAPAERPVPAVIIPVAPAPYSPQRAPLVTPQQAPVEPTLQSQPKINSKQNPATPSATRMKPMQTKQQSSTSKRQLVPSPPHQAEQQAAPPVSAQPRIRVNGIAFQDGSDSVAVINGVPVSRGAVIEGVKVEEIQSDRVQFSYGGEKFEVFLGKTNQ